MDFPPFLLELLSSGKFSVARSMLIILDARKEKVPVVRALTEFHNAMT